MRQDELNKTFYVYMYTSPSGKHYVGRTCNPQKIRSQTNGVGYRGSTAFWNAIQKYGWDNFEYEVLEENIKCEDIDERENYWINYYHSSTDENGYNLKKPNHTCKIFSEEARKRMSESQRKRDNSTYHHGHLSEEHRKSISKALKGKMVGEKNPSYGRVVVVSEETRKKLSKSSSIPVMQFDMNGNYIQTFKSRREAGKVLNIPEKNISACCSGRHKSAYGYQWCNIGEQNKIRKYKSSVETIGNIVQIKNNYIINIYKNARVASKELNFCFSTIYRCLNGQYKTAYGYQWLRLSDVDQSLLDEYYARNNMEVDGHAS